MKKTLTRAQIDSANQQLFEAIIAPDASSSLQLLLEALANGAAPNARPKSENNNWRENQSALEQASRLESPWAGALALALIDAGASVKLGSDGRTALHLASRYGHSNTAMVLVANGLNPAEATKEGWTAFLCAAANGNLALCESLAPRANVKESAEDGSRELRADAPLLLMAAGEPSMALAAYHHGWGSPSTISNSRWTPLMRAIMGQWDDLVQYLASHPECDRNHADFDKKTAMHAAVMVNRPDYLRILAQNGHPLSKFQKNGLSPLSLAIVQGNWESAEELIALGADPAARAAKARKNDGDEASWRGMDALCAAAVSDSHKALAFGLSFIDRCRPSTTSEQSLNTALHNAAANDDPELSALWTKLLLSNGWNPNALNAHLQNPLMHAMAQKNFSAMDELLPVTDLAVKNKSNIDAFGVAEWLQSSCDSPEPLLRLRSFVEKSELSKHIPSAAKKGPSRRAL